MGARRQPQASRVRGDTAVLRALPRHPSEIHDGLFRRRTPPCRRAASLMRYSRAAAGRGASRRQLCQQVGWAQSARQGATHSPASPGNGGGTTVDSTLAVTPNSCREAGLGGPGTTSVVRLRDELFCDRRQDPAGDGGQLLRLEAMVEQRTPSRHCSASNYSKKISSRSVVWQAISKSRSRRALGSVAACQNARADPGPHIHGPFQPQPATAELLHAVHAATADLVRLPNTEMRSPDCPLRRLISPIEA